MWSTDLGEAGKGWPSIDHRQAGAEGLAKRRGGAVWATRSEAGPMTDEIIVEGRGRDQCISWGVRHDGAHYYVERGRVRTRMWIGSHALGRWYQRSSTSSIF